MLKTVLIKLNDKQQYEKKKKKKNKKRKYKRTK